jgi:hypothetical protein
LNIPFPITPSSLIRFMARHNSSSVISLHHHSDVLICWKYLISGYQEPGCLEREKFYRIAMSFAIVSISISYKTHPKYKSWERRCGGCLTQLQEPLLYIFEKCQFILQIMQTVHGNAASIVLIVTFLMRKGLLLSL